MSMLKAQLEHALKKDLGPKDPVIPPMEAIRLLYEYVKEIAEGLNADTGVTKNDFKVLDV